MVENLRFFSIIDKNVRKSFYQFLELVKFPQKGTIIEEDIDDTDFVYIVLDGLVDYMNYTADTKMTIVAATYRTGEVFGDASI